MKKIFWVLGIVLICLWGFHSVTAVAGGAKEKREKVIDFEDELVEGMNKRPLDSLSQVSEAERRRRKQHLYRKRVSFRYESEQTLQEMRYAQ